MHTDDSAGTILVLGGTGTTGRRVVERLSTAAATSAMSSAAGRPVRYGPVSLEQHAPEAAAHGVPREVVELLTYAREAAALGLFNDKERSVA